MIAVRSAALYCVAVDSETVLVDARKPLAGSGMPVPHASDVSVLPIAADNGIDGPSIQVETTNILAGVAVVGS